MCFIWGTSKTFLLQLGTGPHAVLSRTVSHALLHRCFQVTKHSGCRDSFYSSYWKPIKVMILRKSTVWPSYFKLWKYQPRSWKIIYTGSWLLGSCQGRANQGTDWSINPDIFPAHRLPMAFHGCFIDKPRCFWWNTRHNWFFFNLSQLNLWRHSWLFSP